MAISSLSAAVGVSPVLLHPVKLKHPQRDPLKQYNSLHHKKWLNHTVPCSASLSCAASGFCNPSLHVNRKQRFNHTSGRHFASLVCAAALNARCGAEQTQTVEKPVSVISNAPVHNKDPLLDDGGSGFPPRDDGDGGGGGGGGGNWSGGFFFFGFLAFLGFLKDKESEGPYQDHRRN